MLFLLVVIMYFAYCFALDSLFLVVLMVPTNCVEHVWALVVVFGFYMFMCLWFDVIWLILNLSFWVWFECSSRFYVNLNVFSFFDLCYFFSGFGLCLWVWAFGSGISAHVAVLSPFMLRQHSVDLKFLKKKKTSYFIRMVC
jgi:hypothetical protein